MGAESPDDDSMELLETYASTGLGRSKLLEDTKFGSPRTSSIMQECNSLGGTVATIFHKVSDSDSTVVRHPYMARVDRLAREKIPPDNPTKDKLGRSRGFRYPGIPKYVRGQFRDDFVSDKPYHVVTEEDSPEELALTGVNVAKAFTLPRTNWTPPAGPKGLGRLVDGTFSMLQPKPAKIVVQFGSSGNSKSGGERQQQQQQQRPPQTAAGGSLSNNIRNQITERARPGTSREFDQGEVTMMPRPSTSLGVSTNSLKQTMRLGSPSEKQQQQQQRPGTSASGSGGGSRLGTARRRSLSAMEMSLERDAKVAGGGVGGGGGGGGGGGAPSSPSHAQRAAMLTQRGASKQAGAAEGASDTFVKNSAYQRYEVCKQSYPKGILAEERMMRPIFALAGEDVDNGPFVPMEGTLVMDEGLRQEEYRTKKLEKAAISAKYRAGNGDVMTWKEKRNLGTPPRLAQRRRINGLANTRRAELVAEAARRPATAAEPTARVQTPSWMGNAIDMANIGLFSDTIDYDGSKLLAASTLRAKMLQIKSQLVHIDNLMEQKEEKAQHERETGSFAMAEALENGVEQLRQQKSLAQVDLEQIEREMAEHEKGLPTGRPRTGVGALPAGMLETDLRRILRNSSKIELIFLLQSVGVSNTLYPDRNLRALSHQELSNCVAASPIARGRFLEMLRKTPLRTVKNVGAGFLIAADQGGTVKPKWMLKNPDGSPANGRTSIEPYVSPSFSESGTPVPTARSYDDYDGVNTTHFWRSKQKPSGKHSVGSMQLDIFVSKGQDYKVVLPNGVKDGRVLPAGPRRLSLSPSRVGRQPNTVHPPPTVEE